MIVGITGRGGSGKSTFAKKLQEKYPQFVYIEMDLLIKNKVMNSKRLITKVNFLYNNCNYTINDIIGSYFKDDTRSRNIHNCFIEEVEIVLYETIRENNYKNIIVDWFLLHQLKSFNKFDIKILMTLNKNERFKRVSIRTKTSDLNIFKLVDDHYDECYDNIKFDYIFDTSNIDYNKSVNDLKESMVIK